jgi:hypothetical protein
MQGGEPQRWQAAFFALILGVPMIGGDSAVSGGKRGTHDHVRQA